jgi:hypothetical protein
MKLGEELKAFRLTGSQLQFRLHHPDTDDQAARDTPADEFAQWVEDVATFIRTELDDEAEEHAFRFAGDKKSPKDQLDAKLLYIRNDIWPKVREAGCSTASSKGALAAEPRPYKALTDKYAT